MQSAWATPLKPSSTNVAISIRPEWKRHGTRRRSCRASALRPGSEFNPAIPCTSIIRIVRCHRLIRSYARRGQLLRRNAFLDEITLNGFGARLAKRDVRGPITRIVGMSDDLDRACVVQFRQHGCHLIEDCPALRRQRGASRLEFDRAIRKRLVDQALFGLAHAQPVANRVSRIE